MAEKKPNQTGPEQKNDAAAEVMKWFKEQTADKKIAEELFGKNSEAYKNFLEAEESDPQAAAYTFLKKISETSKDAKGVDRAKRGMKIMFDAMKQEHEELLAKKERLEKEAAEASRKKKAASANQAKVTHTPQKKQKINPDNYDIAEGEFELIGEEEKKAEATEEKLSYEKVKINKQAAAEFAKELRIAELKAAGHSEAKLKGKTEAELEDLLAKATNERVGSKEYQLSQDAATAEQYLKNKIPDWKFKTLTTKEAKIAEAEKRSKMSIAEIRESLIQQSPTNRELNRILDAKMLEIVNKLLEDKTVPIVTHKNPDTDSKAALYTLDSLGLLEGREIIAIEKGGTFERGILIDVGGSEEIATITEGRAEFDHHFEGRSIKTSAAEILMGVLHRSGKLETIEPWMQKYMEFVTDFDNMSYPRGGKEQFRNEYPKTILGLRDVLPTEIIVEFFKAGKNPYEPFTDEQMEIRIADTRPDRPNIKKSPDGKIAISELVKNEKNRVEKSIYNVERYEAKAIAEGRKVYSNRFGRVLFYEPNSVNEAQWRIPHGSHAAYNMGYDAYGRYQPDTKSYFFSKPGDELRPWIEDVKAFDPNIRPVRGGMAISQADKENPNSKIGLTEQQLANLIGISIPTSFAAAERTVEYELNDILYSQSRVLMTYENQIAGVRDMIETNITRINANIDAYLAAIEKKKKDTSFDTPDKLKNLEKKIEVLTVEKNAWASKLAGLEKIKNNPKAYWSILDRSKMRTGTNEKPKDLLGKKLELTAAEIEAKHAEVMVEYNDLTEKLGSKGNTLEEVKEWSLRHFNLYNMAYYLQNGAKGEQPKELTWAEFHKNHLSDIIKDAKAKAPAAAATQEAPVVEVEEEPVVKEEEKKEEVVEEVTEPLPENLAPGKKADDGPENTEEPNQPEAPVKSLKERLQEIAEKIKKEEPLTPPEGLLYRTNQDEVNNLVAPVKKPKDVTPENLLASEANTTENKKAGDLETEAVTAEQMTEFISTVLKDTLASSETESLKFRNLKLRGFDQYGSVFKYEMVTPDGTGIRVEGGINFPRKDDPLFSTHIEEGDLSYVSNEGFVDKNIGRLKFVRDVERRERIVSEEERRIDEAVNKAMKDRFGDKLPRVLRP